MLDIFHAAIAAVDPYQAVRKALTIEDNRLIAGMESYPLNDFDRIVVVGAGKAAARMAVAAEETLGNRIKDGCIVVKNGQTAFLQFLDQIEASHPIPDQAGVEGTAKILSIANSADEKTLVICLISGGGSALLVQPMPGITLEEKQRVTELLLRAGATIQETNTVRKHISRVKGGWLAQTAYPASVLTLILSDVIGNALDVIASGPTAPDSTTYADAAAVIEKYRLRPQFPPSVVTWIELGLKGQEAETPKSAEPCFIKTRNLIIGEIATALSAARSKAEALGLSPEVLTAELQGEAREAARVLARTALRTRDLMKPGEQRCLLSGGETTVTVRGAGLGGRNQELALAFALEIEGVPGVALLSAGTDGIDGPTDAAGAIVDGETVKRAREQGMNPEAYLERNDSYSFFKRLDQLAKGKSHIISGSTGTNVMDLQILRIEKKV